MAKPSYPIEMMPDRQRGMGVIVILWFLIITLGPYSLLGLFGVPVPFWRDHLHIRAAWPPVDWVAGPHPGGKCR